MDIKKNLAESNGKYKRLGPLKDKVVIWCVVIKMAVFTPFTLDHKLHALLPKEDYNAYLLMRKAMRSATQE